MRLMQFITFWLLLILLGSAAPAMALNFNAFWLYRVAGSEDRATRSEYQQRYNLGIGPRFEWQPTHALQASANVSYTQAQRDTGEGITKTERVSPSARLNLANDIFSVGLAGSASQGRRDSEWGNVARSWGASLASAWDIPLLPSLGLNYNEQPSSVDSASELFDRPDRLQKTAGASVNWDLLLADLNYSYSRTWVEDLLSGNRIDGDSHFASLQTRGRLLADRVSYSFSQQYQRSEEQGVNFGEVPLSGTGRAKQMFGATNPEDDGDTGGADPEIFTYVVPDEGLPLEVEAGNRIHVFYEFTDVIVQQIDLIRLVFANANARQAPLSWTLYQRRPPDNEDELVPWTSLGSVNAQYDGDDRLEIEVPGNLITQRQLLLVAQTAALVPLTLRSIRAYRVFPEGGEALRESASLNNSWLTNAAARVTLTRTLNLAVNMGLALRDSETTSRSGGGSEKSSTEQEVERLSVGGRLSWAPLGWLASSIGVSDTRETTTATSVNRSGDTVTETETETENHSRTYSWSLQVRPLDTMSVTFGVTRNESDATSAATRRTGSGWQYSLSSTARIYPDLNAGLFLTYAERVNETDDDGRVSTSESESYSTRLNLDARLTRTLSADVSVNYRQTQVRRITADAEVDSENEAAAATLNLIYRPSTYLSVRSFYATQLLDSKQPGRYGVRVNMVLLRTGKTQVTMNYSFSYAEQATNNLNIDSSWDISRRMTLRSRVGYQMAEKDSYSMETALTLRL